MYSSVLISKMGKPSSQSHLGKKRATTVSGIQVDCPEHSSGGVAQWAALALLGWIAAP